MSSLTLPFWTGLETQKELKSVSGLDKFAENYFNLGNTKAKVSHIDTLTINVKLEDDKKPLFLTCVKIIAIATLLLPLTLFLLVVKWLFRVRHIILYQQEPAKKEDVLKGIFSKIQKTKKSRQVDALYSEFIESYQKIEVYPKLFETESLAENYQNAYNNWRDFRISSDEAKTLAKLQEEIELTPKKYNAKKRNTQRIVNSSKWKPSQINGKAVSILSCTGTRKGHKKCEDRSAAHELNIQDKQLGYFAIFDGHNGSSCADYLEKNLSVFISKFLNVANLNNFLEISNALKLGFVNANFDWKLKALEDENLNGGSTACIVLRLENTLYIANTGDTRCLLIQDQKVFQLSKDAKPSEPEFALSVIKRGGAINDGRVSGVGITKAFGDIGAVGLTARPKIRMKTIDGEKPALLIIASDGVWDVIGSEETLSLTSDLTCPMEITKKIMQEAVKRGSQDDITVLVLQL